MMYKDNIGKGWIFMSCDEYSSARVISKRTLSTWVQNSIWDISRWQNACVPKHKPGSDSIGKQLAPRYSLLQWLLWKRVVSAMCMGDSKPTAAGNFEQPQNSIVNVWWMVNTLQIFQRAGNGIELVACCKTMCAQDTKSMFRPTHNEKRRVHARFLSPTTCPKG